MCPWKASGHVIGEKTRPAAWSSSKDCLNKPWRTWCAILVETLAEQPPCQGPRAVVKLTKLVVGGVCRLVMVVACLPDGRSSFPRNKEHHCDFTRVHLKAKSDGNVSACQLDILSSTTLHISSLHFTLAPVYPPALLLSSPQ